jgi:mono/diheme cytochrome c family protein
MMTFSALEGVRRTASARLSLRPVLPLLLLAVGACATVGQAPEADPSMGLLIAQNSCAGCHQIGGGGPSPNERAPRFDDVVNRHGMSEQALAAWLRDAHNYPIEMGFTLEPHQVDSLAAYMIRWRSSQTPAVR